MKRLSIRVLLILCLCLLLCACDGGNQAAIETPAPTEGVEIVQAEEKVYFSAETGLWQYLDENQAQYINLNGKEWTLPGYDSSAWSRGYGPFGAKDGEKAVISEKYEINTLLKQYIEGDNDNKQSFFFRIGFQVDNPLLVQQLQASISYDDAVIIYLNGHQVHSGNVPADGYDGNFAYGADYPQGAPISEKVVIPAEYLIAGENLLAVELHQSDKKSSDLYFNMERLEALPGDIRLVYIGPGSDSGSVNVCWIQSGRKNDKAAILISKLGSARPPVSYPAVQVEPNAAGYTYRAEISGIDESSRYSYTVVGGSGKTDTFRTGTGSDGTDILMLGDPQLHIDDYKQFCKSLSSTLSDEAKGMDLAVCFGDVSSEAEDYIVYEKTVDSLTSCLVPMAMIIGNHDIRTDNLSDCVALPNMTKYGASARTGSMSGDYWFEWNGNLFLCLNGNEIDCTQHRSFIEEAINAYRSAYGEPEWKLVLMHQAIFSQGNNYQREEIQKLREELAPIFTEFDIDAVFSGHDHTYSRSYLMQDADIFKYEGEQATRQKGQVLYVTLNCCSGAKFYDLSPVQDYTAFCRQSYKAMYTKVNLTPNRMHIVTWEPEDGRIVDDFYMMKKQG